MQTRARRPQGTPLRAAHSCRVAPTRVGQKALACSCDERLGIYVVRRERPLSSERDQEFESAPLQRRVRCEPISPAGGAERQAPAAVLSAGEEA